MLHNIGRHHVLRKVEIEMPPGGFLYDVAEEAAHHFSAREHIAAKAQHVPIRNALSQDAT